MACQNFITEKDLNVIDIESKYSVFGFIRAIEKQFSIHIIPQLVYMLILSFYYEHEDFFEITGDHSLVFSDKKGIIKHISAPLSSYGKKTISSLSKSVYSWDIQINKLSDWFFMIGVCSGIDTRKGFGYDTESSNYCNYATGYKISKGNKTRYGGKFAVNNRGISKFVVTVKLNLKLRQIEFYHDGVSQGIAYTNIDVGSDINYRLAICMYGNDSLTIKDFTVTNFYDIQYMATVTRQLFVVTACFVWHMYSDNITCDGGTKLPDCTGQKISCTADELCAVHCKLDFQNATEYNVCVDSVINCKKHQQCVVRCDSGIAGCRHIIINAQNATKLDVISSNSDSFIDAKIYCPTSGTCNFIANPVDTDRAFYGMNILSQAGFDSNVIDIECNRPNCLTNVRINCTSDYSQSCFIDRCMNNSCGGLLYPTPNPTIKPTANNSLQTESNHDNQTDIILVSTIMIIALCCGVSIYTINKCWQYEKTVDESDYITKAARTDREVAGQPQLHTKISRLKRLTFDSININIPSVRTSVAALQIQRDLEMAQSRSPSSEKHQKNNKSHTQTLTDDISMPGLTKTNTAQQELELDAIFEEMMQDFTDKLDDYSSDSHYQSTKI